MSAERHVIVLVGRKGAGKTTLGTLLDSAFGIHFVHVEKLWIEHARQPRDAAWESDGFARVAKAVESALDCHSVVTIETTGAAACTAAFLNDLRSFASVHLVAVDAPAATCAARVRQRAAEDHVAVTEEELAAINARAAAAHLSASAVVANAQNWDEDSARGELGRALASLGIPAPRANR